jgi:hypothetical protein
MPVEGVLRNPVGGQLNHDGYFLYRGLCANFNVVLTTFDSQAKFKAWAAMENINGHSNVLYPDFVMNITESYWVNVGNYLQRHGYDIAFFVLNDPEDAAELLSYGKPVLLHVQPAYAMPEWLPDSERGRPSWDMLVERVMIDRAARASDNRTEIEL